MSVRVMSQVWDLELGAGEKLVLLCLADQANDEGWQCWPAVSTICKRSGQGERTVRRALDSLEKQGHLTRHYRDGASTQYHVHPCQSGTPAKSAPLPKTTVTPANLAPKPSRNTSSQKTASSSKERASKPRFVLPPDIPSIEWAEYEEMRRAIRKPMTDGIRGKAIARLRKLAEDGYPPGDVLSHSILNSYQGLFPPKEDRNAAVQSHRGPNARSSDGFGNALREAAEHFRSPH